VITPKQKVMDLAEKLGATIDIDPASSDFTVTVTAPEGHHWNDEELHLLVESQFRGYTTYPLWVTLLERMQLGVETCHENCGWWDAEAPDFTKPVAS